MTTASRFGDDSNGQKVDLAVGQTIELCLPENPTTGFRWHLTANEGAVCAIVSDVFRPPGGLSGRGGEHGWLFEAVHPGECDIELHYRRPWAGSVDPARAFRIHVRVKRAANKTDP
jgi:inhibitor of cysteine peptidase